MSSSEVVKYAVKTIQDDFLIHDCIQKIGLV